MMVTADQTSGDEETDDEHVPPAKRKREAYVRQIKVPELSTYPPPPRVAPPTDRQPSETNRCYACGGASTSRENILMRRRAPEMTLTWPTARLSQRQRKTATGRSEGVTTSGATAKFPKRTDGWNKWQSSDRRSAVWCRLARRYVDTMRPAMVACRYSRAVESGERDTEEGGSHYPMIEQLITEEGGDHDAVPEQLASEKGGGGVAVEEQRISEEGEAASDATAPTAAATSVTMELSGRAVPDRAVVGQVRLTRKTTERDARSKALSALCDEGRRPNMGSLK
ncbi:unnamed protein product [Phytophthora fragariaefolia]|uniref:Unnamed protein product n=1 Tax=Phytophthora fragariaefolia TaxID=1490495 RepID=A0A9W6TZD5_9STRA|nr:unnamed protein product [Phytophthora fragariaefolia]